MTEAYSKLSSHLSYSNPNCAMLATSQVSQQSKRVLMRPGLLISFIKHFAPYSGSGYLLLKAALSHVNNKFQRLVAES